MTVPLAAAARIISAGMVLQAGDAKPDEFVLVDRELTSRAVRVVEVNESVLEYLDDAGELRPKSLDQCIALIPRSPTAVATTSGLLLLSDGQRLPGTLAASASPAESVLSWAHSWLGRIDVPLDRIAAASFRPAQPLPEAERADVIVLNNGDRLNGFVVSLGDPIAIEIEAEGGPRQVQIPIERAAAVALITPRRRPAGRRVWFRDGTVIEVDSLGVRDDGFLRLRTGWMGGESPIQVQLSEVAGILFAPGAIIPLIDIAPARIETAIPRFVVPAPLVDEAGAVLGLGHVEYSGPLTVRYALPPGCRRFAAEARVPAAARAWADFELIVRDDDEQVYRRRLNAENPTDEINVGLTGSELTIEITLGDHGPIQDRVLLNRAMFLVE